MGLNGLLIEIHEPTYNLVQPILEFQFFPPAKPLPRTFRRVLSSCHSPLLPEPSRSSNPLSHDPHGLRRGRHRSSGCILERTGRHQDGDRGAGGAGTVSRPDELPAARSERGGDPDNAGRARSHRQPPVLRRPTYRTPYRTPQALLPPEPPRRRRSRAALMLGNNCWSTGNYCLEESLYRLNFCSSASILMFNFLY